MPQVNGKYNDDGNKRASWYISLWNYAVTGEEGELIKEYGMDDDDRATLKQYQNHIVECERKGIVPQFGWSWEG